MPTTQTQLRQTGFTVGDVSVRFGLLWPEGSVLMNDWSRRPKEAELDGIGDLTVIQFFGHGPRQVTYRVFFETIAEFQALDELVQQTGTLRVVHGGHTVPVNPADVHWIHDRQYSSLLNAALRSLVSVGVAPDGVCEAEATFVVST